jgi:hypothetical protein
VFFKPTVAPGVISPLAKSSQTIRLSQAILLDAGLFWSNSSHIIRQDALPTIALDGSNIHWFGLALGQYVNNENMSNVTHYDKASDNQPRN